MGDDGSRLDRELIELLNEVRVVLPGLSVLFAFMLTVPFTERFTDLDRAQRGVFFALFLVTLGALLLLKAPTAFHRIQFRERDKEALIRYSNRCTIAGMVLTGLALCLAVFLVSSLLFDATAAWIATGVAGLVTIVLWFAIPLARKA